MIKTLDYDPEYKRNDRGYRVGSDHQRAKLSDEAVLAMRAKWRSRISNGATYRSLAEEFGCGESTARDIVKRWTRTDV